MAVDESSRYNSGTFHDRQLMITYLDLSPDSAELPLQFPSPFVDSPHSLAATAARRLQAKLENDIPFDHDFFIDGGGKMFGVLVVRDKQGRLGYLSAFSGMLDDGWTKDGFAEPLFELTAINAFLPQGEQAIAQLVELRRELMESSEYTHAQEQLSSMETHSKRLQLDLQRAHLNNKSARKIRREQANLTQDDEALARLSFESQQDKRERRVLRVKLLEQVKKAEKGFRVYSEQSNQLEKQYQNISRELQKRVFDCYGINSIGGQSVELQQLFEAKLPPGGTADCAAPKLLAMAIQYSYQPIAIAEFWWGASPLSGVRHHKQYYPSCRGKCGPLLPFMLQGLDVQITPSLPIDAPAEEPPAVYEDDDIVVVNKPSGMLSVPGIDYADSVELRMQHRYPHATGALMVHRLDMSTSGLLLVAKNAAAHKNLQAQFIERRVKKRYVAILDGVLEKDSGEVNLPLRVEIDDRPRQRVCDKHGKAALTHWEVVDRSDTQTRVWFYPHTGRTHQLRLHASHKRGLAAPIAGDELYGVRSDRLKLHAERLEFYHPVSGEYLCIKVDAPF